MIVQDERSIETKEAIGRAHIKDLLSSLLVAESLNPGVIYILSPWISDFPVLDNTTGNFDAVNPKWGHRHVYFFELLQNCVEAGATLKLAIRENRDKMHQLEQNLCNYSSRFKVVELKDLHEKGLLTDCALIRGSMNFTYFGATVNYECITYTTNPAQIAEKRNTYEDLYFKEVLSKETSAEDDDDWY
ncbi:phospholipase D-like domain-containing protein DpdK [Shewanella sp. 3_MG-2023]|uniref:phospholipase D-like domain-containing protein DpdK n=1 Tax=Shewanella sp. 3_MG-2023 TaxID=3062635 RepID=UPI0026E4643F|nr:phospholipase D-like domain-containing protein DpdK [Shewanella sp. 3_MG-2023]MDO6777380.1 phospholipase D-like domain-containing protein DpdK [Shewanella sp. 3_MG-2023]